MADEEILYDNLRRKVETFTGVTPETRRHFDMLAQILFERTRAMVSATTLRRFWGYQEMGYSGLSRNTLNVLSRFVGYTNWNAFVQQDLLVDSSELMDVRQELAVTALTVGNKVEVTWMPDRRIVIEYLGADTFRVLSSENSKLMAGDTFHCSQIVASKSMFCNNLLRPGSPVMSYVCGKTGGVSFHMIKK